MKETTMSIFDLQKTTQTTPKTTTSKKHPKPSIQYICSVYDGLK
jgi:hypothetical protein